MGSFDFDGNEVHKVKMVLKIELLDFVHLKERVELFEYRVIVSSMFLWLILSSYQAWIKDRLILRVFKLRYVKDWTSDSSYNCCCEIILSSSISFEIFVMLFFQKLFKIIVKCGFKQSSVLFLLDKLSSNICFFNSEGIWKPFTRHCLFNLFN